MLEAENMSKRWRCLELCYCQRRLLPIKLFYFSFSAALGVVLPYASVFLKQLGLSASQIGVISGIRPALGFISGPLWGSIADRFRIRRVLMLVSVIAWLGFFVGLYFISPAQRRESCPDILLPSRLGVKFRSSGLFNSTEHLLQNGTNVTHYEFYNRTAVAGSGKFDELRENLAWLYEPEGLSRVFVTSLLIICGGELFQSPTSAISDAATLEILGREGLGQYGAQRAWGAVGWAISSLSVGALLSAQRSPETVCGVTIFYTDYRIITVVFIAIIGCAFAAALNIDFDVAPVSKEKMVRNGEKSEESNQYKTLAIFKLFLNLHYGSWIATAFYVGICNGVIWGFLFWHLDNLGASQLLMGVDSLVACFFEFGTFFFVEHVIEYVGHMGVMYIGLSGYIVRFFIYASLVNPWYVLPAEALQGITFSFIWVSLTSYSAVAVPTASLATIQGIIHGVYFGLGNGLGTFFGGVVIGAYGAATTFNVLAMITAVWLLLFAALQQLTLKPTNQFDYLDMEKSCDDKLTLASASASASASTVNMSER